MLGIYSCAIFLLVLFFHESHAGDAGCIFMAGDGSGHSEKWIGYMSQSNCVDACIARRRTDARINGVTVYASGAPGCYCEIKMKGRNDNGKYKSCFIGDSNTDRDNRCLYLVGDAIGTGKSIHIGNLKGSQCVDACLKEKESNPTINGVIVRANNKPGCWCETYMKGRNTNADYKSCFIGDTGLQGDYRCQYKPGDGSGHDEIKIGNQKGSKCVDACLEQKRTKHPSINGVTVLINNNGGCWCEMRMSGRHASGHYKSCYIGTHGLGK